METPKPFFSITKNDIALLVACLVLLDQRCDADPNAQDPKYKKWTVAIKELLKKLSDSDSLPEQIPLNAYEAYILQYSITDSLTFLTAAIQHRNENKNKPDEYAKAKELYQYLQDEASDILLRLTKAIGYNDAGLDCLNNVFGIKTGVVRQLHLNDTKEIILMELNGFSSIAFRVFFGVLDLLEMYQDNYAFARKIYSYQYIHLADYRALRDKIAPALKPGKSVSLTQNDCIALYWVGSMIQRLYVSDAADLLTDSDTAKNDPVNFKKTRECQFIYLEKLLSDIKTILQKDEVTKPYLEMVNQWEIPMDDK